MLLIAVAATALCCIWIVLDATFDDVFLVYGRSFRVGWQMRAWSVFAYCGWRFLIVIGVIALNLWLAYQATRRREIGAETVTLALWSGAVLFAVGLVPWTFVTSAFRKRRSLLANAKMLTPIATRFSTAPDLSTELVPAGYRTESGWDAWHPTSGLYQSTEGQNPWRRTVPVVYTSAGSPRTVVIPIDWSNFVVWGCAPAFAHSGEFLPFGGPGTSRFRAGSRVERVDAGDCWIMRAELDLPEGGR